VAGSGLTTEVSLPGHGIKPSDLRTFGPRLGHGLATALESSSVTDRYEIRILIGPCSPEEAEAALDAALFESVLPRCPASGATLTPQRESEPDRPR
jgi:hypothetical protein